MSTRRVSRLLAKQVNARHDPFGLMTEFTAGYLFYDLIWSDEFNDWLTHRFSLLPDDLPVDPHHRADLIIGRRVLRREKA